MYVESSYYHTAPAGTTKPRALLVQEMAPTGMVAIARYVIRNRQHIAALRTGDGAPMLSTPRYADELASSSRRYPGDR